MNKNKTSYKSALILVIVGLVLGLLIALIPRSFIQGSSTTSISATTLKTSLESASDLIATRYNYAKVGQFSNSLEMNGWTIPFTEKNFLLSYQGQASLGVDMSQADVQVVDQTIEVHLPAIEVLNNTIDESSIEVYNESTNVFNPIRVSDYLQFAIQQKKVVEQQLEQEGVYNLAEQDASAAITSLLQMIPEVKENYTLEIRFDEHKPVSSDTADSSAAESSADPDPADGNAGSGENTSPNEKAEG